MTKKTRKERVVEIISKLQEAFDELDMLAEEVQEHVDNMGETNLEYTEQYADLEEEASTLDDKRNQLDELISELGDELS